MPTELQARQGSGRLLVAIVALTVLFGMAIAPGGVIGQETQDDLEGPHLICGDVTINGEPAPEGMKVTAHLEGEVFGPQETNETGHFAGCLLGDEKIEVDPDESPDDPTITFFVDGMQAEETIEFEGLSQDEMSLTVETDVELESIDVDLDETTITEGDTTGATVTATYDDGSTEDVTDQAEITSADESIATVDGATITGEAPGTVDITADYEGHSDSETLTVEALALVAIDLSLEETTIIEGETTTATVTAMYEDESTEDVTDQADITSNDESIATVDGAEILGEASGVVDITATYESESDEETVTVEEEDVELVSIDLVLHDTVIKEGQTTSATVMAEYDDGSTEDVTADADISSEDETVATVDGATIVGETPGTAEITADYQGQTDSETLTVEAVELESIELTLDDTTIDEGTSTTATVTAHFDDGSTEDVTAEAELTSPDESVASVDGATIVGEGPGTAELTAQYEDATDSATLTVEEVLEVVAIDLTLDDTTIGEGQTTTATVTATYEDGSTDDVTAQAELSSADASIASIDGATIVGESPGTVTITATFDGETDSVVVTVEALELEEIDLTLGDTTIGEGQTTAATVTATFEDGSTADVTNQAVISSGDENIATVSGATVVGASPGEVSITAEYDGESDSETLTVEAVELEGITLSLDETTLGDGETTVATVVATFDDGSTEDVTDLAEITSADETIATVDGATILAEAPGEVELTAAYEGETDSATLTVEEAIQLEAIDVTLEADRIDEGETTTVTVTAEFDDGSTADVTDEADVTSDDETVASVDGATLLGEAAGTVDVTASFEGETDSATLTVLAVEEPAPFFELTAVDVPAEAEAGAELQVTVTITNTGDDSGTTTVSYEFLGDVVEQQISLSSQETTTLSFTASMPEDPGEYEITISTGDQTQSVSTIVDDAPDVDEPDEPTDDDGMSPFVALFGLLILLAILAGTGYWLWQQSE